MGTISSGVGLISGIDTRKIIDGLMAVEQRPVTLIQNTITTLKSQKTAYLDINARLLALQSAGASLGKADLFNSKQVTSSNSNVLTATASNSAAPGTYSFTVNRLVSTHQLLSTGFADTDTTNVGATTLRFESALARLDGDTNLTALNGGSGVQRGKIRITDRSGATADIDLTKSVTVNDVLDTINAATGLSVKASLGTDGLVLTDSSGGAGNLVVQELGSTATAANLGILGNSGGTSTLTGTQINKLGSATQLAALNDGLGVRILGAGQTDFTITDSIAGSSNISLDGAKNIGDVISKINTQASGVTASLGADGVSLKLTSTGGGDITVADTVLSHAAHDLGLVGTQTGGTFTGSRVIAALGSKLLKNLGGGAGVTGGVINVNGTAVNLSSATSIADVINGINAVKGSTNVTASLNTAGNGITLTHASGSSFSVSDTSGTLAASLHISGASTNGKIESGDRDLQWISTTTCLATLNGGKGVAAGKFKITNSSGVSAQIDLTQGESTINDVIKEINSRGISVTATINSTGDGILLTDTAGGASKMKVEEDGSTTAKDLGLLGTDDDGDGKIDGSFEKTVTITGTDKLQDVVDKINQAGIFVSASIVNDGSPTSPYRLAIASNNSGTAGQILMDDGGVGLNASTLVKGSDAVVLFGSSNPANALLLTSSTNTLTNTITGVTVNLTGVSDGPVSLSVTRDDSAAVTAAKTFVTAFNGVVDTLNKYDSYNSDTQQKGVLLGDGTAAQVRSRLYALVNSKYSVSGQYNFLSQVGITIGDGAKLSLDADKLSTALATNNSSVVNLFTATTTAASADTSNLPTGITIPTTTITKPIGFGPLVEQAMKSMTDAVTGLLTLKTNSIDNTVMLNNDRIDEINKLLTAKKTRLQKQFADMESALATLQSQQSALAGITTVSK
jgi:flagellar hook-associated protein 2